MRLISRPSGLLQQIAFPIDESNRAIRQTQLHHRLSVYPSLIFSQMALEPLVVWLFWDRISHDVLLSWLTGLWLLHGIEIGFWHNQTRNDDSVPMLRRLHRNYTFFSACVAAMWGVASFLFYTSDPFSQILLICILLGLVAASVDSNPSHPPSLYLFALIALLPLIVRVACEGDRDHLILAAMMLAYLYVVLSAGGHLSRSLYTSLKQNLENQQLVEQLTATQQQLESANELLRQHGKELADKVQERTTELFSKMQEVTLVKEATLLAFESLAGTRDNETGNHIRRTQNYVVALAKRLRNHPRFQRFLTDENIDLLYKVAPLHDIGKVGVPDAILLKPGKLTPEEFEIMKSHATLGGNAISAAESKLGGHSNFLYMARQIATYHHEKWDGSGYPHGLRGDDIPIPARLMAVADVYDALITRRVYKPAFSHEQAAAIIIEGRGKHFDPEIVDAFVESQQDFQFIAHQFAD